MGRDAIIRLHVDLMANQLQRDPRQRPHDAFNYGAVFTTHARVGTDDETDDEIHDAYKDAQRASSVVK